MKAVCVCKHRYCCLFSLVPLFPHEARTVPQSESPTPTHRPPHSSSFCSHRSFHVNENAVFLLLYQMTRKCVTLTLEDKLPPPPPKYLQSAPLTHVRKSGGREVGVGAGGERGQGEMVFGGGGAYSEIKYRRYKRVSGTWKSCGF